MIELKPKKLSEEESAALTKALSAQTGMTTKPKSRDNENFPVFEVPVNTKLFVYVPNHEMVDKDGNISLRMDTPYIHSVKENNRYSKVRCVEGLFGRVSGYPEGEQCPFCKAASESWDLAKEIINEKCRLKGLDPENKSDNDVKAIRSACFSDRVVKNADPYVTFPIVVIETDPSDIKKLVRDEDGNLRYKIMWYSISQSAYMDKWIKALENIEEAPEHPGGRCFVLDYTYNVKEGSQPSKMDSARNLSVHPRKSKGFEEYMKFFDKETESWTPEKARETVIDNTIAEYDQLSEACDMVMLSPREKLQFYHEFHGMNGNSSQSIGAAQSLLAGATKTASSGVEENEDIPVSGSMETDMD